MTIHLKKKDLFKSLFFKELDFILNHMYLSIGSICT